MRFTTKLFFALTTFLALGSSSAFAAVPTTAAPTPPARAAAKVISIFSNEYTNVASTNFNPGWGQATVVTTIDVAGSATLSYANLNYQGTEFGSDVNAAGMTNLHIDVYSSDETAIQLFCISRTAPTEKPKTLTLVQNQWNSFDIPLTDYTSQGMSMAALFQFKVVGTNGKTVYLDNLYFYDSSATVDTEVPAAFTAVKGLATFNSMELVCSATDNSNAVSFEVTYDGTTVTAGSASGVSKSITINGLSASTAYSFSVVAKDATGNVAANSPIVIDASTTAAPSAAPVPTVDAAKVLSVFSDTYTPALPAINYNPGWGQSTVVTTVALGGSATLKYANLNYQGTDFGGNINASAMNTMHVDVWTADATSIKITPISAGKEFLVTLTPLTASGWSSFDIPLSSFTGVNTAAIYQIKVDGGGGKTVYLDNIYFYDNTPAADTEAPAAFTAVKGLVTANSVELLLSATDNSGTVNFDITYGGTTVSASSASGVEKTVTISGLTSLTDYSFSVVAKDAAGNVAANNPIIVAASTIDTEAPATFTAVKGIVTTTSVELTLSATDNSGAVDFDITYGATTETASSASGVEKKVTISGLTSSTDYSFSVVAKDASGNTSAQIIVTATTSAIVDGPTAAPAPTVDAAKVLSVFSDTYTPALPAIDFNPNWGQATKVTTEDLGGNAALKYTTLNYQGTDFKGTIDASTMNFIHVDVWTADETSLQITPISVGPKEKLLALAPLSLNVWNSFDIALSNFTGVDLSALFQIKVVGSTGKTVYLDNIYFYSVPTSLPSSESVNGIKLYPNPASDKVTLVATSEIKEVVISNLLGQTVQVLSINALEANISLDQLTAGQYFVTIRQANGTVSTEKLIKQ